MTKMFRFLLLSVLLGASGTSFALDESQAEDMADLTAVFIYLKNDCGYQDIPDAQIWHRSPSGAIRTQDFAGLSASPGFRRAYIPPVTRLPIIIDSRYIPT